MQKNNILIAVSMVLVATSGTASVIFMRQNATLRNNIKGLRSELQVQLNVPLTQPVSGTSLQGAPLTVSLLEKSPSATPPRAKLMLVLSPECRFCAANWKNWHDLITKRDAGLNWEPIFVNVGPPLAGEYVHRHEMGTSIIFQSVSTETAVAYKFFSTPQTIVVDGSGRARFVWKGVLGAKQMADIRQLLARGDQGTVPSANIHINNNNNQGHN